MGPVVREGPVRRDRDSDLDWSHCRFLQERSEKSSDLSICIRGGY